MKLSATNPVTVLLLVSSEGYFGVENMLVNLAASLVKMECRCVVGVFRDSRFGHIEVADRAREQGLTVELVPCAGRFDPRAALRIREIVRKHQVDVIHTHGYKADLYARAGAIGSSVHLVATCHNWLGRSLNMRAYAALDRIALRAFDRIVVVSEVVGDILQRSGIPADRLQTIANGVEVDRFRAAPPTLTNELAPTHAPIIGFVGRLVPDKGGETLLRAAQVVLRSGRLANFVIVGEGPARDEWEQLASTLGIREQVVFTGARSDMPGIYASFQLLALPSLCEAMPMCLLEAMAAGKAVIATNVGAVPKIVDPDATGILIEPGDVRGLSAAITRLLDAPKLARWMGENGQHRIIEHFSSNSMARQYLDVYRTVTGLRQLRDPKLSLSPTA